MKRRRRPQRNPSYNSVLVTHPGVDGIGALTKLYAYQEKDSDTKEQRQRLAARVLWEPHVPLPPIVDAADLRTVNEQSPVTRIRRLRVASRPPVALPPLHTDLAALGRLALTARKAEKQERQRQQAGLRHKPARKERTGAGGAVWVRLDRIQTNRSHQPREGLIEENVRRIVQTYLNEPKEFWQLFQPPEVRPLDGGRYELIHGHHRFEAAKRIRAAVAQQGGADPFPRGIPVKILHVTPERARQIADAANLSNAPMRPTEIAPLLARWLDAGNTPEQIMQAMPGLAQNGVKKGDIPAYARVAALPRTLIEGLDNPALRNRYTLAHAIEFARAQDQYDFRPDELQALYTKLFITDPKEVTPASLRQTLSFLGSKMKDFRKDEAAGPDMFSMFGASDFGAGQSGLLDAFSQLTATQSALEGEQRKLARLRGSLERADLPALRDPKLRKQLIDEAEDRIAALKAEAGDLKKQLWGGIAEQRRAANPIMTPAEAVERVRRALNRRSGHTWWVGIVRNALQVRPRHSRGMTSESEAADLRSLMRLDPLAITERGVAFALDPFTLSEVVARAEGRFDQSFVPRQRSRLDNPRLPSVHQNDWPKFRTRDRGPLPVGYDYRVGDRVEFPAELDGGKPGLGLLGTVVATRDEMAMVPEFNLRVRADKSGHVIRVSKQEAAPFGSVRPIWGVQQRLLNPHLRLPSGHQAVFDADGTLYTVPHVERYITDDDQPLAGRQTGFAFGADDDLDLHARVLTPDEERAVNRGKLRPAVGQGRMFNPRTEHAPCPGCGHDLTIRPHATRLRCPECDALVAVHRR